MRDLELAFKGVCTVGSGVDKEELEEEEEEDESFPPPVANWLAFLNFWEVLLINWGERERGGGF